MELKDGSKGEVCPNCRGSLSQNTLTIFPTEEMIEKDLDVYENAVTRLAKEFPQCSDLSLIHALIHIKKGEYKKAEKILDREFGKAEPEHISPEAHLILAKLKFFSDMPREAKKELFTALEKGDIRWVDCLVETINLFQGDGVEEVTERFLPLLKNLNINFSTECVKVVRLLLKEENLPEAYFLLQRYRSKFSDSPHFQMLYSSVAISLGEYSAALQTLSRYLEQNKDDALAYIYLAKAHIFRGEYREAVRALKRGYSVDPHIRWSGVVLELKEGLMRLLNLNYYRDSYEDRLKHLFKSIVNRSINLEDLVRRAPPEKYVDYFCTILLEMESLTENVKENIEEIKKVKDKWLASEVNVYIEENIKLIEKKLAKGLTFDAAHTIERLNMTIKYLMEKSTEEMEELYEEKYETVQLLHDHGVISEELFNSFEEIDRRESSPEKYYLFFDLYFHFLDNFYRNFGESFEEFLKSIGDELNEMEKNDFPVGYLRKELQTVKNLPGVEKKIEGALKIKKEIEEINRTFWVKEGDYLLKEIEVKLTSLERLGYDTSDYRDELKKMEEMRRGVNPQTYFDRINELFNELEAVLKEEKRRRAIGILNSSIILKIISLSAESFAPERYYFKSVLDILEKFISRESYDRVGGIYSQIVKEYLDRITPEEDSCSKEIVMDVLSSIIRELKRSEMKYLIYTRFVSLEAKARNLLKDSYSFYMEALTDMTSMLLTYEESLAEIIREVTENASEVARTIKDICPDVERVAKEAGYGEMGSPQREHADIFRMFYAHSIKKLYERQSRDCLNKFVRETEKRIRNIIQETLQISSDPDVLIDVQTEGARAWSLYQNGEILESVALYREVEERARKALKGAFERYRKSLKEELEGIVNELSMVMDPPERFLKFIRSLSTPLKGAGVDNIKAFIEKGSAVKKELLSMLMVEKATVAGNIREYIEKCEKLAEGWESAEALLASLERYRKRLEGENKEMKALKELLAETKDLYLKVLYNRRFLKVYEEAEALATSLIKKGTIKSSRMEEIERIKEEAEKAFKEGDVKSVEEATENLEKILSELNLTQNMQTVENIYSKIESLYDLITLQLRDLKHPPWRDFRAEFLKRLEELERETREESLTLEVGRLQNINSELSELKRRMQMVEESWELYQQLTSTGEKRSLGVAERIKRALYDRNFKALEESLRSGDDLLKKAAERDKKKEKKEKAPKRTGFKGISRLASEAYMKARIMDDGPKKKTSPQGLGALIRTVPEPKGREAPEVTEEETHPVSPGEPDSSPQFIFGHIGDEEFYIKEYSWVILLPGLLDTVGQGEPVSREVYEEFIVLVRKMLEEAKDLPDKALIEKKLQKASYYLRVDDILRATYFLRSISKTLYNYLHLAKHLKTTLISFSTVLDNRRAAGVDISAYLKTFLSCVNLYNSGYLMSCGEKVRKLKSAISKP